MTRQEAARIITVILDCCKGKEEDYEEHEIIPLEKSFEALGMAIQALEQEPTAEYSSDVISRQAAIDALYDKGLNMTAWGEVLAMKWSDIQKCIEQLPSAGRPTGHWIWMGEQGDSRFMCSACKCKENVPTIMGEPTVWGFCPNCGSYNGGDADGSD